MEYRTFEQKVMDIVGTDVMWGELNLSSIRKVNKAMRSLDESHLYPIRGRFNATDRAIRRYREYHNANGYGGVYEYVLGIDGEISRIVNSF